MSAQWTRPIAWLSRAPSPPTVPLLAFLVMAALTGTTTTVYRYHRLWTPLQRHYLRAYTRSGLAVTAAGTYEVLQLTDKGVRRPAVDDDVLLVTVGSTTDPAFALTETARQAGRTQLGWQAVVYPHAALHRWLWEAIYSEQTLVDLVLPSVWAAVAVAFGMAAGATVQRVVIARAGYPVEVAPSECRMSAKNARLAPQPSPVLPAHAPGSASADVAPAALPSPTSSPSDAEVWPPHYFA